MKKYYAPAIEILSMEASDIIATSSDFTLSNDEVNAVDALSRESEWFN